MRITFPEIAVKATRRWVDADGKKRQQTRKFWQTQNPFNKHANGVPKTYEEILAAVKSERDAWLNERPSPQHRTGET